MWVYLDYFTFLLDYLSTKHMQNKEEREININKLLFFIVTPHYISEANIVISLVSLQITFCIRAKAHFFPFFCPIIRKDAEYQIKK